MGKGTRKITCKWCGAELSENQPGPCSQCGKTGRLKTILIEETFYAKTRKNWEKRKEFKKTNPILNVLVITVSIASPFAGLLISGWIGVAVGLLIGALLYVLGPLAVIKIREVARGKS